MHFDFSISLGQLLTIVSIIGSGGIIVRRLDRLVWEHDMMWHDFAEAHDIPLHEKRKKI